MDIDVHVPVKMLSIAERQSIEIVKALSIDARVLVMDEPTSAISGREVDRLFEIVRHLQKQGVAILFISHFIEEILGVSDEVTILRSGRRVVTRPAAELTPAQTVRYMIGTEPGAFFPKEEAEIGEPVLGVRGLSGAGFVEDVSFDLRAGEILGFFGLVGAGRSEIAEMIFGITRPDRGEIGSTAGPSGFARPARRCGSASRSCPRIATSRGWCCNSRSAPTRRCRSCAGSPARSASSTARGRRRLRAEFAKRMRVVATGVEQLTSTLSGGNQQKVLLAKWLIPSPKILILDQPTRGIDVGAKAEIHRIISHLATQGIAIILIGDDAEEVMAMADRIIVFRGGRMAAESMRGAFDREAMLLAAAHASRRRRIRLACRMTESRPKRRVVLVAASPAAFVGRLLRAARAAPPVRAARHRRWR